MTVVVPGKPKRLGKGEPRFPLLVSYPYLIKAKPVYKHWILNEAKKNGIDVLLDSGAFSAANLGITIELKDYVAFLQEHGSAFYKYVLLDVLKDPVQTRKNWQVMVGEGLSPVPVHVWGDDEKRMDELFDSSPTVALGGLRRPGQRAAPKNYVVKKMEWAKGRNVHWLGYTNLDMVQALRPWGCDCSSFTSADRYGRCDIYVGSGKFYPVARRDRTKRLPLYVVGALESLGYGERDWVLDRNWRQVGGSSMASEVTVASWIRYIMDVRSYVGTRVFMAGSLVNPHQNAMIKKHWGLVKEYRESNGR